MSLDFAVLGPHGAPERSISLDVDLHHELITAASAYQIASLQYFADYYEDATVGFDTLPTLAEHIHFLHDKTQSTALQRFLDDLAALIAYAIAQGKPLHTIAD